MSCYFVTIRDIMFAVLSDSHVLACCTLFLSDTYAPQDQLPPSPVFAPMQWKRAHLLWASLAMQCLLLGIWEFSYSNTFATHVYMFIVGFKLAQVQNRSISGLN